MNENALNTFYNNIVKSDTTFSADYDTFKNGMQDTNVRKELYKRLRESNTNFPANDYDVDVVLGFQTQFDKVATKATNKAVSNLRNEKYASLSDDEIYEKWNSLLSKGEQNKTANIEKLKKEDEQFAKQKPFLHAISMAGMQSGPAGDRISTPIEALEGKHASAFLDPSDLEEFKALDKERGVRIYESGNKDVKTSTIAASNEVKDIRDRANRENKKLSARERIDLNMAERINDMSQKLIEAPSKFGEESGVANWGKGLSDTLFDRDIISVVGMVRDWEVSNVVKKLNDGETLTEAENAMILAVANFDEVQASRSSDLSVGYQIGQGTAQCVPLIVDMMVTKGLGAAGKRALIKSLDKLVKAGKMTQKSVDRFARILNGTKGVTYTVGKGDDAIKVTVGALEGGAKKTFGQYAGDAARELVETGIQTYAMPSSQRQMIQAKTDLRRESGSNDISFKDRARIFGDAYTQTFTERAGGKAIDWALGKVFGMTNVLQKFGYDRGILKLLNDAVQNPISEIGEEYLGAVINLVRSADLFDIYSEQSNEDLRDEAMSMFTSEGFWRTVGTTLPMSLFGGASNYGAIKAEINRYNKSYLELSQYLQKSGIEKSQAENILRQVESAKNNAEFKERMSILKTYLTNYIMENNPDTEVANGKLEGMKTLLDTYSNNRDSYEEAIGGLEYALSSMSKEAKEKVAEDFKKLVDNANRSITATPQKEGKDVTPADKQSSGWDKRKYSVTIDGKKENVTIQGELYFNEDGSINSTQTDMGKVHIQNEQGKNIRTTVKADKKKEVFNKYLDAINDELRKQKAQKDAEAIAEQKAEEARKAELAKIKAEEKAKLDAENAKLEEEKQAIVQQEADRQNIIASFPKDKNGEVDIDKMSPEQFFVYESDTDSPEAAMNTVGDVLNDLYQQLEENTNETNREKRARNAAKIKNRIRQYEAVVVKYAGQETLDNINAARAEALQLDTHPVQEGAPVIAPVVEQAQGETPAEPAAPEQETPQDDVPAEPDTTPLPPAEPVVENGEVNEEEKEPMNLLDGQYAIVGSNSTRGKEQVVKVTQNEDGTETWTSIDDGKTVSQRAYKKQQFPEQDNMRVLGIKEGNEITPVIVLSGLADLSQAKGELKVVPVNTKDGKVHEVHVSLLYKPDAEGGWTLLKGTGSRVLSPAEAAKYNSLDALLDFPIIPNVTVGNFTLRDILEYPTLAKLKSRLEQLGIEYDKQTINTNLETALARWRELVRENNLNEEFKNNLDKLSPTTLAVYKLYRAGVEPFKAGVPIADTMRTRSNINLYVQLDSIGMLPNNISNPLAQLAVLAEVASDLGIIQKKAKGSYLDAINGILEKTKKEVDANTEEFTKPKEAVEEKATEDKQPEQPKTETPKQQKPKTEAKEETPAPAKRKTNIDSLRDTFVEAYARTKNQSYNALQKTTAKNAFKGMIDKMSEEDAIALYLNLAMESAKSQGKMQEDMANAAQALLDSKHGAAINAITGGVQQETNQTPVEATEEATGETEQTPEDAIDYEALVAERNELQETIYDMEDDEAANANARINEINEILRNRAEFMEGNRAIRITEEQIIGFRIVTRALNRANVKWVETTQEEAKRVAAENGRAELLKTPNAIVYGYALDGVIYITPEGMNANTPIHEYTHLWVKAMQKFNPQGWRSILSVLRKEEKLMNQVRLSLGENYKKYSEDYIASEALSRYVGTYGEERLLQEARLSVSETPNMEDDIRIMTIVSRIKKALNEFWHWVGTNLFNIQHFESVEEIANQVLYDLFNETNLANPNKNSTFAAQKPLTPEELENGRKDFFRRMANGEFEDENGYSRSANFFHRFVNGQLVNSIQIEGNESIIEKIENEYGNNANSGTSNKGSSSIQRTEGPSDRDNAISERQREWNDGVDGLHEERTSNISPNNQEVDRNIREIEAEREQIIAEAKANGTYMLAPNGKPTNLTEDQWVEVRTQAFKDWFGDWQNDPANASKVLDENGEPLVVYHGSKMAGFDEFQQLDESVNGFFTTDNKAGANTYATNREERRNNVMADEAQLNTEPHHGIYSLFVNIKNPAVYDFAGKMYNEYGEPLGYYVEMSGEEWDNQPVPKFATEEEALAFARENGEPDSAVKTTYLSTDDLVEMAKAAGHDGVIFKNVLDGAEHNEEQPVMNDYIAFEPNQLKSATQNIGTYSSEDNRIEFMIGPAAENETEEKIKKASEDVESAFVTADVPLPDKTNALAKLATAVCDSGEAFRQFMKALRKYRKENHLGKLPEGRDIRQIYDNQRVVLKNKVTELLNLYETPLEETLEKLIKVVEDSSMYRKYQEDKVVYTIEEEDADGKITTKTWTDYVEITPREFIERYLIACDSVERLNNGIPPRGLREFYSRMGVNVYDFQMEFEAAFASDGEGEALVKELWKRINAYTNYTLEDSYECGMLTEEEYNKRKARKFYVPERDFQAEKELEQTEIKPQKHYRSNKLASSKQAKGGDSLAANIIENMIHIGNIDLSKNNKNRVKLAMFNLLKENEDFRRSIGLPKPEEVWYDSDGKRVSNKPSKTLIERIKWLESQMEEYRSLIEIEESQANPDTVEIEQWKNELQDLIDERNGIPYMLEYDARDKFFGENNPHMVGVYVDGVLCSMQFPNMGLIATALNDTWADSLAVRDVLKRISGYFGSIITTYEPTFFSVNTVTDSIAILTKGYVELGLEYSARFIATTKDLGKHMSLITAYMTGKDYRSMENGDLFRDFLMNGGNTGYATIRNMETILEELQVLDNKSNHIKDTKKWIKKTLSFTNESAELLLRFAAYKAAIECGHGVEKATWAANNLSANFNRTGKKFNDTNFGWRALGEAMEWFKSLSMFTNPAIQGAMSYLRMFGDSGELSTKERVAKYFRLFNAAMFMPALCGFLNAMMFDDDEQEEWAVSEYDRANYLVLGKLGKWAVPHMLRPFYNIGVNIAMGMQGRRTGGDIADSIITSFLTHLTPLPPVLTETASKGVHSAFGNADFTFFDGIESLVSPQGINTLKELADGENFLGYKVRYEGSTAQYTKNPNAGAFEKIIAEQFYIWGGGIEGSDSKITNNCNTIGRFWDVSPNEMKSLMQLLFPKLVIDVANITAGSISEEHDVRLKDIPVINRFVSDRTKEAYRAGIYSEANKINKANDMIVKAAKGDIERLKIDLGKASSEEERVRIQGEIDFYKGIHKQAKGDVFAITIEKNLEKYKRIRMASLHKKYHHDEKSFKKLYPDLKYDVIEDAEKMFTFNMFQLVCMYNGTGKVNDNLPNWMKDVFRMKPSTQEVNEMWEHYQKLQEENNERLGLSEQ